MAKKSGTRKAGKERSSKERRAPKGDRAEGPEKPSYRERIRGKRLAEGKKNSGCAPKLFMLLLPFLVAGAYLYLGS